MLGDLPRHTVYMREAKRRWQTWASRMWRGCVQALRANTPQYASGLTAEQHTPSYRTMSQKLSILRPSAPSPLRLSMAPRLSAPSASVILRFPKGGAYARHTGRSWGRSAPGSGDAGDLRAYPSSFQAHAGADGMLLA